MLVFLAGELCQDSRAEVPLLSVTLDHHTSPDKQMLNIRRGDEGDVVAGHEALLLPFEINFVFQPTIFCKEKIYCGGLSKVQNY